MRVVSEENIRIGWLTSCVGGPGVKLTLVLKQTFALLPGQACAVAKKQEDLSGDVPFDGEGNQPPKYSSDFVPFKPRADFLLASKAYAPEGKPVETIEAGVRVGQFRKAVQVTGDRFWQRRLWFWSQSTAPKTFVSMPIVYARAFGGQKFKWNRIGIGDDRKQLPNVESPSRLIRGRGDRPPPIGLAALPADWEPRRSKVGSYGGRWVKERWPWFPDDFDYGYFNAAPEDQQMEYLRGDEELEFHHLHPKHAVYRSRLPGLRARGFVQTGLPGTNPEFREVPLKLDTLWIDTDAEKLVLVWRGLTETRTIKAKEITHIAGLTEPLATQPRSLSEMRVWMEGIILRDSGKGPPTPEQAAAAAAEKALSEAAAKGMALMEKELAEAKKEIEAAEQESAKLFEQEKAKLIGRGMDPKVLDAPQKPQTVDDLKAAVAMQISQLKAKAPDAAAKLAEVEQGLAEVAKMEQQIAALEAHWPQPPNAEAVQAAALKGKPVADGNLSGLDLSNLDLSGGDFSGANFSGANLSGTKLTGARLTGGDFSKANLSGADLSGAHLEEADFSKAKIEGAKFSRAVIKGASFTGLQLPGADFSGCSGGHPNFSKCNLEGANFTGAKLPEADFCRAVLKGAHFVRAELPSADLGGAIAEGIDMEDAVLTNLRAAEKSNFAGGKFRNAKAAKSIWEGAMLDGADFTGATLTGALFEGASVNKAQFVRADLTKASFEDASAQYAVLSYANLLRAIFNRADLTEATLEGSNLYEASFWGTVFVNTNVERSNRKRTTIAD